MTPPATEIQAQIDRRLAELRHLYGLLNAPRPTGERLTRRELDVLTLRASTPLTMAEIGARLFVTENAVKAVAKVGRRKLGVKRPDQLPAALARVAGEVAA